MGNDDPITVNTDMYYQHEQWFDCSEWVSTGEGAMEKTIVNSYGRVRKIFSDGGYADIHQGGERND